MIRGTWLPKGVRVRYLDASVGGFALDADAFGAELDAAAAQPFRATKGKRPAFIPALYKPGKPRKGVHIVALTGIAVDVDCDRREHKPFDAPAALASLPFKAFAWTTQGHGDEAKGSDSTHPRVRFFVPLAEPYAVGSVGEAKAAMRALAALLERYGFTKAAGADPAGERLNQGAVLPSRPDPKATAPQWRATNTEGLLSAHAIPTADGGIATLASLVAAGEATAAAIEATPALTPGEIDRIRADWAAVGGVGTGLVDEAIAGAVARIEAAVRLGDGRKQAAWGSGNALGKALGTGTVPQARERHAVATMRRLLRGQDAALEQLARGIEWGKQRPMCAPSGAPREPLLAASARLESWFDRSWLAAGVHVAAVDMGLGKSRTMRGRAVEWMLGASSDGGCGLIIVPTQHAARETVVALRESVARQGGGALDKLRVRIDHGRSVDPESKLHCAELATHRERARVSKAAAKAFCDACPRLDDCAFMSNHRRMRRDPSALWGREILVRTQARQREAKDGDAYAWLVSDEGLPTAGQATVTRAQLHWAIGARVLTGAAVTALAELEGTARADSLALLGTDAAIDQAKWDDEVARCTSEGWSTMPSEDALAALAEAIAEGWHGVEVDRHGAVQVALAYPKPLARPACCIVLDGTATRAHARAQWGEVDTYTEIRAESLGRVVAVVGEGALTPDAVLPREGRDNANGWAAYRAFHAPVPGVHTVHIMRKRVTSHPLGMALVDELVTTGDAETYVGAADARGSNAYEDCDRVVCDPYRVPGHAVRAEARALRLAGVPSAEATAAARHVLEHAEILQAVARVRAVRREREIVTWGVVPGLTYTHTTSLAELANVSGASLPPSRAMRDAAVALVSERGAVTLDCVSASIHAGLRGRNTTPDCASIAIGTSGSSVPPPHPGLDSKTGAPPSAPHDAAAFATSAGLQVVRVTSSLPGEARAVLYAGDAPGEVALRALFGRLGATWFYCPNTSLVVALDACPWRAAIRALPAGTEATPTTLAAVRGASASLARRWVRSIGGREALALLAAEINGTERSEVGEGVTVTDVGVTTDLRPGESSTAPARPVVLFEHTPNTGAQLLLPLGAQDHDHERRRIPPRLDTRTG